MAACWLLNTCLHGTRWSLPKRAVYVRAIFTVDDKMIVDICNSILGVVVSAFILFHKPKPHQYSLPKIRQFANIIFLNQSAPLNADMHTMYNNVLQPYSEGMKQDLGVGVPLNIISGLVQLLDYGLLLFQPRHFV